VGSLLERKPGLITNKCRNLICNYGLMIVSHERSSFVFYFISLINILMDVFSVLFLEYVVSTIKRGMKH
jgi:hypothetical protein